MAEDKEKLISDARLENSCTGRGCPTPESGPEN
jgi:hypothetical protein